MNSQLRRGWLFLGAAIALLLAASGCYTTLRHPQIEEVNQNSAEGSPYRVGLRDDCASCHGDYHAYWDPYSPYARYDARRYQRWHYYYQDPWWLDEFYYSGSSVNESPTQEQPLVPRDFRRRRAQDPTGPPAAGIPSGEGAVAKKFTPSEQPQGEQKQVQEDPRRKPTDEKVEEGREQRREKKKKDENQ